MALNSNIKTGAVLLLALGLSSCEKVINSDLPPHSPMVVCNSTFTDKAPLVFKLNRSKSILDTGSFEQLKDAWILVEEDGVFREKVYMNPASGLHQSTLVPTGGRTYRITIQEPDGETGITAESTLPEYPDVIASSFKDSVYFDTSGYYGELRFTLRDPGAEGYYNVGLYYYNTSLMDYLPFDYETDDALLSSNASYAQSDGTITFNNVSFRGGEREFVFSVPNGFYQTQPNFLVVLKKLSPELFKYQQSLTLFEVVKDDPFAEPVQVFSNIKNGIGIFAGFTEIRDTIQ